MSEPFDVTYLSDGAEVPARVWRGRPRTGAAGVLLCPGRFRDIDGLAFLSQALAARGHVLLATTYRGMDFFTDDTDAAAGLDTWRRGEEIPDLADIVIVDADQVPVGCGLPGRFLLEACEPRGHLGERCLQPGPLLLPRGEGAVERLLRRVLLVIEECQG